MWSDGSAYSFPNWAPNKPSSKHNYSCGTTYLEKWHNSACNGYNYFLCYTGELSVVFGHNLTFTEILVQSFILQFDNTAFCITAVKDQRLFKVELKTTDASVDMEVLQNDILEKVIKTLSIKIEWHFISTNQNRQNKQTNKQKMDPHIFFPTSSSLR